MITSTRGNHAKGAPLQLALGRARLAHRALRYSYKLDPKEIRLIRGWLRPGNTAIDFGAHKGAYTWWLARQVGRTGRVAAVEPQEMLAERLRALFARTPQVSAHWAAGSDSVGTATLSLRSATGPTHGASISGFSSGPTEATVEVPTMTLGEVVRVARLDRVDLIKCDTEGAELRILTAGRDIIEQHRPALLVECEARHERGDEICRVQSLRHLFEPMGYSISCVFGRELVPVDRFDASRHQQYGDGPYGNNFWITPERR